MLQRNWLVIIAFGLMLAVPALAQDAQQTEQNDTGSQRQNGTGENGAAPPGISVRILEVPEQSDSARNEEKESAQREQDDLVAQESMAKATEQIVMWTALQFGLACLGTVALIHSVQLNRRATKAAVDANRTAREIGEKQTRAYLSVSSIHFYINDQDQAVFEFGFANSGQSPALGVSVNVTPSMTIANVGSQFPSELSFHPDIAGNDRMPVDIPLVGKISAFEDDYTLGVFAEIKYRTVFSNRELSFDVMGRARLNGFPPPRGQRIRLAGTTGVRNDLDQ